MGTAVAIDPERYKTLMEWARSSDSSKCEAVVRHMRKQGLVSDYHEAFVRAAKGRGDEQVINGLTEDELLNCKGLFAALVKNGSFHIRKETARNVTPRVMEKYPYETLLLATKAWGCEEPVLFGDSGWVYYAEFFRIYVDPRTLAEKAMAQVRAESAQHPIRSPVRKLIIKRRARCKI